MAERDEPHWRDHPVLAGVVRILATLGPLLAGIATGLVAAVALPTPTTTIAFIGWWALVLAVSVLATKTADRLFRRLLPLAVLLELSLLFPDHAPSRFKVALTGGSTKHLHEHLVAARKAGVAGDINEASTAILALVAALGSHHRPSRKHSERVRAYTELIAEELALPAKDRHRLRWASLLHDVGKVSVPFEILEGTGELTPESWEVIQRHPSEGGRLITPLWDWLGPWAPTIEQHHERYDGAGYPHGLKGDDICLGARIVAVADSFEAMTAKRSYQEAMSIDAARRRMATLAGSQFDPAIVRAFLAISVRRLKWAYGPLAWAPETPAILAVANVGQGLPTTSVRGAAAILGMTAAASTMGVLPDTAVLGETFDRDRPADTVRVPTVTNDPHSTPAADGAPRAEPPATATTPPGAGPAADTATTSSTLLPPITITIPPVTLTIPPITTAPTPLTTPTTTTVPTTLDGNVPSIP